ncbi:putative kinase inhibitor [Roseibium album]|nr:putative kinase inhibitor [Roseibium album]
MNPAKYTLALTALLIASNTALSEEVQPGFTLSSPDISEGQTLASDFVFKGFGCEGANVSPALKWEGAPAGTESFAVTVYDPDAPTGSGWWHWFAFNIPSGVTELPKNTVAGKGLPKGTLELANDYGATGFGGACPPPGEVHRYKFTVNALSTVLELDENVSNALAGYMVNANSIASSTITAVYHR